jgi:hypothetical protein
MSVYNIGVTNYLLLGSKRTREDLPRYSLGFSGRSFTGTKISNQGSYGKTFSVENYTGSQFFENG